MISHSQYFYFSYYYFYASQKETGCFALNEI